MHTCLLPPTPHLLISNGVSATAEAWGAGGKKGWVLSSRSLLCVCPNAVEITHTRAMFEQWAFFFWTTDAKKLRMLSLLVGWDVSEVLWGCRKHQDSWQWALSTFLQLYSTETIRHDSRKRPGLIKKCPTHVESTQVLSSQAAFQEFLLNYRSSFNSWKI